MRPSIDSIDSSVLLDGAEPHTLEKHLLRRLRAQVRVRRLLLDEDTANLAKLCVHPSNLEVDATIVDDEPLVVLLEELIIASSLHRWQGDRLVVAGRGTAALRVQEQPSAVRGHLEVARELGRGVDIVPVALGLRHEVLHREEERHALASRHLDRRWRVVDAVLLPESKLAALGCESALNAGQRVGLPRRDLGVHGLRHKALLRELVAAANTDLRAAARVLNAGARVRQTGALDL